jgi:hypothetical protein
MAGRTKAGAVHEIARMMREADARRKAEKALAQRKKQAAEVGVPFVSGSGPTPERMRADEWDDGSDAKGHRINAKTTPHLMRSRIARMQRDKWVDRDQAAALAAYEILVEKAGYGNGRSCLDNTPGGGEAGTSRIDARNRLAEVRRGCDINALMVLHSILWPDPMFGPQTVTQVAVRLFPGREAAALKQVRCFVEALATQLAELLHITQRPRLHVVRAA